MNVTADLIEEYFNRYGWTFSTESDNTWITGVRTRVSAFRIMVRLTEHWVFFIINPLVVSPSFKDERLRVYYHALRYNLDMNFAKIGVDSDGDLFMAIEIPTENFTYSHFVDALDGISHHATMVYAELFGLAHNPGGTLGRYDDELEDDTDELDENLDLSDLPIDVEGDDIIIGGRRLKITDDQEGKVQIEFEEDDDDDEEPPPPPKPRRSRKKPNSDQ